MADYYSSQKQAAAGEGVPIEMVREACGQDASIVIAAGRVLKEPLREWLRNNAWKKRQPVADEEVPLEEKSHAELKRMREIVALKRESLHLDKERDRLLPVAEYQAALARTVSAFSLFLDQLPGRAAGRIAERARIAVLALLRSTLTETQYNRAEAALDTNTIEYADIAEILSEEAAIAKATLSQAEFLEDGE